MMALYDVAVAGGGLAGCSAAITLAARGWRVVLFERAAYPHHKVCGEFLSPECADYLDDLGITPALRALRPRSVHRVAISTPNGTRWETQLSRAGLSISRYRLDQTLAERALSLGVDLRPETTVTHIEGDLRRTFRVRTRSASSVEQVGARIVIAAHGKRSALDRTLQRDFLQRPQPYTALKAHFYGPPLLGSVELHTFAGGYCGLGEVEDGLTNVCLLARTEVFQRAGSIETFVEWMQTQNPQLRRWFSGARQASERWLSIAQVPFQSKPPIEGDVLMAGDAAGLIAPLTGDGMSMALHGGQMAAQYVHQFLEETISAESLRGQYAAAWTRSFSRRLWIGRVLQPCLFQPRLLALGLRILKRTPPVGRFLFNQTRDVGYQPG
jgi:flavin-dependent dehydrogenase